ncbi:hypothetical protein C8R48DRAFT_776800 [Suillus tomentosus]|nr:hypothetical protein C8R48DRAFT_776800 [Suillus tomentosus]
MAHWEQNGGQWPYPGHSHGDFESPSHLQPPESSLPLNTNIQPTPGFRLASEILPAHNATTASGGGERSGYSDPHWQDRVGAASSHPSFDSQYNELQLGYTSQAAADVATYDHNNSYTQDSLGGSQHQPLASDIPGVSNTASYSFQLPHSQDPTAGGSQHPPPVSGIPTLITSYTTYQSSSSQPAVDSDGSQHLPLAPGMAAPITPYMYQGLSLQEPAAGQYQFSVTPPPNIASHNDYNPYLQEQAGSSRNPSLQPVQQFATEGRFYRAISSHLHHSSSNACQNVLHESAPSQTSLNSTSSDPIQIQAAQTQSTLSGLGAHIPNDEGCCPTDLQTKSMSDRLGWTRNANQGVAHASQPESSFDRLGRTRNIIQRIARGSPYKAPPPSIPPQSSRSILIPSSTLDDVKKGASIRMTTSLFQNSLFPSTENINEWAQSALECAAAAHDENKRELGQWIKRREGLNTLSQLKRTVKRLHSNSRDYAEGFVAGAFGLSFDMSKAATDITPSRQAYATLLLSTNEFLDTFVQRMQNGQLKWFRVPFAHPGIIGMVEYMLVNQQFRRHIEFDSPDWESRLINVIALAGMIARWVVSRYSVNGWFKEAELYTLANEKYHTELKTRMFSLSGDEEILFRELLRTIRSVLLSLPVY